MQLPNCSTVSVLEQSDWSHIRRLRAGLPLRAPRFHNPAPVATCRSPQDFLERVLDVGRRLCVSSFNVSMPLHDGKRTILDSVGMHSNGMLKHDDQKIPTKLQPSSAIPAGCIAFRNCAWSTVGVLVDSRSSGFRRYLAGRLIRPKPVAQLRPFRQGLPWQGSAGLSHPLANIATPAVVVVVGIMDLYFRLILNIPLHYIIIIKIYHYVLNIWHHLYHHPNNPNY